MGRDGRDLLGRTVEKSVRKARYGHGHDSHIYFGVSRKKESGGTRICEECHCELSHYNKDTICNPCQEKKLSPD